jgi:hypothetical protein
VSRDKGERNDSGAESVFGGMYEKKVITPPVETG